MLLHATEQSLPRVRPWRASQPTPRLARALLDGSAVVGQRAAAETVALVAGDQRAPGADLTKLLTALRSGSDPGARRFAEDVRRMESLIQKETRVRQEVAAVVHPTPPAGVTEREAPGFVVALAFPDRVARRVPGDGSTTYLLSSGTRAGLPPLAVHCPGTIGSRLPRCRAPRDVMPPAPARSSVPPRPCRLKWRKLPRRISSRRRCGRSLTRAG